jgi:hypothetical protein
VVRVSSRKKFVVEVVMAVSHTVSTPSPTGPPPPKKKNAVEENSGRKAKNEDVGSKVTESELDREDSNS